MMQRAKWPKWSGGLAGIILLLIINGIARPSFFHVTIQDGHFFGYLIDILRNSAPIMIIGLGMTLVIGTGGVDLSVGAVVAISGAVGAKLAVRDASLSEIFGRSLLISGICGLWNGLLVSVLGVQPIVATLILMVSGRGIAQLLSDGQIITFHNDRFVAWTQGYWLGMPVGLWWAIGFALLLVVVLNKTALGLFLETTGDNAEASRFSGVPVRLIKTLVYTIAAVCAGFAGLIVAAGTKAADANHAGLYFELDAILAVVLGGTTLNGGRVNLLGTLIGALLIQTLTTTIFNLGIAPSWTLVVKATVVIVVCLLQADLLLERLRKTRMEQTR